MKAERSKSANVWSGADFLGHGMPYVHPQRPMKAAHAMKDHNGRPFGSLFASICENAV